MNKSGSWRILLVDDEPMMLSALRRHIERICPSATVVYALNPQSAVWQLRNTSIALVMTDMRMEGRDDAGWAVVDAAQQLDVPVVVLTGSSIDVDTSPRSGRHVAVRRKDSIDRQCVEDLVGPALAIAASA
jgi:CheY-like chemotaxis protein